jgi:hypothetical protein
MFKLKNITSKRDLTLMLLYSLICKIQQNPRGKALLKVIQPGSGRLGSDGRGEQCYKFTGL